VTREVAAPKNESFAFPENVSLFQPEDLPALRAIGRVSHRDSRFYYDPSFPSHRCDDLYETWIENSCTGGAAGVVVARSGGSAVGYVTCEIPEEGLGNLGLVAVAQGEVGQGHGGRMVEGALGWLGSKDCTRIQVVTQARNVNAARLYEAGGFKTIRVENSYHLWLSRKESE
jgi:dTDP-4-amino-4,6-dideoxy-D-galactose acyltransferase